MSMMPPSQTSGEIGRTKGGTIGKGSRRKGDMHYSAISFGKKIINKFQMYVDFTKHFYVNDLASHNTL